MSPSARCEIMRPRLQSDAYVRPLDFTSDLRGEARE